MEKEAIEKITVLASKKADLLNQNPLQYIMRAVLAGIYISFAVIVSFRLGDTFYQAQSPFTPLMSGISFGIALMLIIWGGAELFTGNTMYFTVAALRKKTGAADLLKNWFFCYSGNFLGVTFFAGLFVMTGLFAAIGPDHMMMDVVETKMNLTASELFFRAILCNWLVCLAIWIPMQAKGDGAKLAMTILLVFAFFVSGYEHSIANMSLFTLALMLPHPETISVAGMVHNLVPVTLGNIVGGGVFVGALYTYLQTSKKPAENKAVQQAVLTSSPHQSVSS
ncbi:formate/nitrite transporter family protein [Bacillus marinisedimentorum]|uniref:formate/nitrite transporter family protein n=1 Tax=Bacillus marinisedimentorum TaxID=1821260 RepID=UPI000871DD7E|nr:formate/nitrite transporter family protein [Bacillus marinisedimentorum]